MVMDGENKGKERVLMHQHITDQFQENSHTGSSLLTLYNSLCIMIMRIHIYMSI